MQRGDRAQRWALAGLGRRDTKARQGHVDSHRLAPYPELTFQFLGGWGGAGRGGGQEGEMRPRGKHTELDGKGSANLGTKAAQQAQGKGGGRKQPASL